MGVFLRLSLEIMGVFLVLSLEIMGVIFEGS